MDEFDSLLFDYEGRPLPPEDRTPAQLRADAAVQRLVGYYAPHLRGGFLFGALDDETETAADERRWHAWVLTGDRADNLALAALLPDILSAFVNAQFRSADKLLAEDAVRKQQDLGYYYGLILPQATPPPLRAEGFSRAMKSAGAALTELFSTYLLVGRILTAEIEDEYGNLMVKAQTVPVLKYSEPPDGSKEAYWLSVLLAVSYAHRVFLAKHRLQPTVLILDRIVDELHDVVDLRAALRQPNS